MIELPQISDYKKLFLNETEMMDVRAPVEFLQGAFPHACNLPLMNDDEREAVGLRYKNMGQDDAIELGHELVSGEIKTQRVADWADFVKSNPQGVLYCFRGGLRSKITQQWIYDETGIVFPRVKGGYKALRRFLIDELEKSTESVQPVILGGRTGTGKTILLNKLTAKIDLEGIFNHRGSVFGNHVTPQPSQIDIENQLSIELLKLLNSEITNIVFEDEAPNIGSRNIPMNLYAKMKTSPLILLEESVEDRVDIIFDEYITHSLQQYISVYNEDLGFRKWSEQLLNALSKVQRRLGGERYKVLDQIMQDAIKEQLNTGTADKHKEWINNLLVDYYDPMYDYQLTKKTERVIFQGSQKDILEYLKQHFNID
ncbi:MAG: tRNA 2-selenouridine(34) synthase MnmH [Gammaproteobacteria bacterium]|nr:tRNA 2-selenouridine(34) synthase MnmH [Gammaproteobacteria bacterium]